jgi:hypothetical protein
MTMLKLNDNERCDRADEKKTHVEVSIPGLCERMHCDGFHLTPFSRHDLLKVNNSG